MEDLPSTQLPCQNGERCIARRSVSIFSRRGTASPKSGTTSIYGTMIDTAQESIKGESPKSSRKSLWSKKSRQSTKNQGTVLHAVPPYMTGHSMSPLEVAMAISPNEEILQAIGKASIVDTPSSISPLDNSGAGVISPSHGSFNTRIGTWRDGVTSWEVRTSPTETAEGPSRPARTTKSPFRLEKIQRPRLSVVIPGSKLRQLLGEDAPIPHEAYRPVHITPGTRRSMSAGTIGSDQSAIHPAFRTTSPLRDSQIIEVGSLSSRDNSRSSIASNTIFHDDTFDNRSCYSRKSSMTSVEAELIEDIVQNPHWNCLDIPKRSASAAFSIASPVQAGIFDEASGDGVTPRAGSSSQTVQSDADLHRPSSRVKATMISEQSTEGSSRSLRIQTPPSPTLSEAVHDLQTHLTSITEEFSVSGTEAAAYLGPNNPPDNDDLARAPTLPKRSRKREWIRPGNPRGTEIVIPEVGVPVRRQSVPSRQQQKTIDLENDLRRASSVRCSLLCSTESTRRSSLALNEPQYHPAPSNGGAVASVFQQSSLCQRIMSLSSSFEDLKALSMINKTTRQVFEDDKLQLFKSVLFNTSPPAWELREWSPFPFGAFIPTDFHEDAGITPSTYMSCVRHDRAVVVELKSVIVSRCQSFLRPETISSLMTEDSMRFEAAIYRIWTFCKIFGCDKGREHDLKGQLDWLRGGPLAHQKGCAATLNFNPEFDVDGILLNPPDHFGGGNGAGLSAEQLYDMTEIWDCLCTLLQPYETNTAKAQKCGIFQHTAGPEPSHALLLQEWIAYTLTLGPPVTLELARFHDSSDAGYDFAHLNNWTAHWTPPHAGTSRRAFLRSPLSQAYEEALMATAAAGTQMRDASKTALRKRQTVELHRRPHQAAHCALTRRDSALAPEVHRRRSSRAASSLSPSSPSGGWRVQPATWSPRKVSPVIEDRVHTFNRLSLLGLNGNAEDTAGLAVAKIVDMGFSPSQAREALRITDMGCGLRLDRAVDYLLRKC